MLLGQLGEIDFVSLRPPYFSAAIALTEIHQGRSQFGSGLDYLCQTPNHWRDGGSIKKSLLSLPDSCSLLWQLPTEMSGGKWGRQEEIKSCWTDSYSARWPDGALGSHLLHLQLIQLAKLGSRESSTGTSVPCSKQWRKHLVRRLFQHWGCWGFQLACPRSPRKWSLFTFPCVYTCKMFMNYPFSSVRTKQRKNRWEVNIRNFLAGKKV